MRVQFYGLLLVAIVLPACGDTGGEGITEVDLKDRGIIFDDAMPPDLGADMSQADMGTPDVGQTDMAVPDASQADMGAQSCDDPVEITIETIEIGEIQINQGRSGRAAFNVPDDAVGFSITAQGSPASLVSIEHLESPDGELLVAENPEGVTITQVDSFISPFPGPYKSPNRSVTTSNVGGILAPNNAAVAISEGRWTFKLGQLGGQTGARATGSANVTIHIKRAAQHPSCGSLPIHFFFTGSHGWTAATAPNDPDFLRAIERFSRFYADVGVQVGPFTYDDLGNPMDWRTVEAQPGGGAPGSLGGLFAHNTYDDGLAYFFVERFSSPFGNNVIGGIAGGIPGPSYQGRTSGSGVAVSTTLDPSPEAIGHIMGHEGGHFLGLFHTIEQFPNQFDQINDTEESQASNWNLMFPTVTDGEARISDEQGWVLHNNPLIMSP